MAWNNSAEAARYASQYPNFKNPYTQHDVPPPQKKTFYPQTGQPHSTHQQPSYHSTAHGAHGAQGTHDPGRYYPEQTPPQQHTYASSASMSSNYSYRSSAAAGGTPLPAPGYARDTGAGAYPSYGHASSSQQREPEPHHAQPFEREREPYHMHQGSREPERHHQQHQHQHPPQQHHQQHQQQQQPQYQPQQVPSPRDAGGVKEEDHVPATSPMVSPRPVVITCPFEKLGKVMAEVDSIRVRFERNSFTSLTHSDSLTDDSILKTRKSYDESLMRCMLQLDAIEAVGDDRDKIKAERRSVIANIQKLQSCLEDFVERERTLRELENTQSIS